MTTFDSSSPPLARIPSATSGRPPFPTITQAVVLTILLLLAQLVTGLTLGVIAAVLGQKPDKLPQAGLMGLGNVISFVVVLKIGLRWGRLPARQAIPLRPIPITLIMPLAITIIGLSPLLSDLGNLVVLLLPLPDLIAQFFDTTVGSEEQAWQLMLLLVVIAPLTEEPIFRGLMLNGLLQQRRPWVAIFVTAVLFAAMHLNPWQFSPALVLGLLFGWWFLRTRSIWPCVLGHLINNSMPFVAASIPGFEIPGYTSSASEAILFQPLWFDMAGLALLVVGLIWTGWMFGRLPAPPSSRSTAKAVRPAETWVET